MSPVRFACVSALVFAVLTINGCGGGGDAEPAPLAAPSKAFVADRGQATIGSSSNSNPGPGTVVAERRIVGPNTMLSANLGDLALDGTNDRLYVAELRSILVFNNASTANGNVAPSRVVSSFGGVGNFVGIYLDTVNDRLYAAVNFGLTNQVQVFDKVSTLSSAPPTGPRPSPKLAKSGATSGAWPSIAWKNARSATCIFISASFWRMPKTTASWWSMARPEYPARMLPVFGYTPPPASCTSTWRNPRAN